MIAYKGFRGDLTCTLGKGTFQYSAAEPAKASRSKCADSGLHCVEYPLECLEWYPPCRGNRYFEVEAEGSIDECQEDTKIACTRMTLLRELTVFQLAALGMMYMVRYPLRAWELQGYGYEVKRDRAAAAQGGAVAIARGIRPRVRGRAGAALGLLVEDTDGAIQAAKAFQVAGGVKPDTWYVLEGNKLKEEGT